MYHLYMASKKNELMETEARMVNTRGWVRGIREMLMKVHKFAVRRKVIKI